MSHIWSLWRNIFDNTYGLDTTYALSGPLDFQRSHYWMGQTTKTHNIYDCVCEELRFYYNTFARLCCNCYCHIYFPIYPWSTYFESNIFLWHCTFHFHNTNLYAGIRGALNYNTSSLCNCRQRCYSNRNDLQNQDVIVNVNSSPLSL